LPCCERCSTCEIEGENRRGPRPSSPPVLTRHPYAAVTSTASKVTFPAMDPLYADPLNTVNVTVLDRPNARAAGGWLPVCFAAAECFVGLWLARLRIVWTAPLPSMRLVPALYTPLKRSTIWACHWAGSAPRLPLDCQCILSHHSSLRTNVSSSPFLPVLQSTRWACRSPSLCRPSPPPPAACLSSWTLRRSGECCCCLRCSIWALFR